MVKPFLVRRFTLLLLCFLAPPSLAQGPTTNPFVSNTSRLLGTVQLAFTLEQNTAYLNGEPFSFSSVPRLVSGRAMVPLREFADALNLDLFMTAESVRLGKLEVKKDFSAVLMAGQPTDLLSAQLLEGQIYVAVRTLSDALEGVLGVSSDGRTLTLTLLSQREGSVGQPQARFSTNKTRYAQGEPVLVADYSYDPDGLDLPSRKWSGKQATYFTPGEQTLTLQVSNQKGISSLPYSRKITITDERVDSPLTYALKYAPLGSSFPDSSLPYPRLNPLLGSPDFTPLLFSDSPENVPTQGLLYQDTVYPGVNTVTPGTGRVRIVAHHVNGTSSNARVFVVARNPDTQPLSIRSSRLGETAPARFAGTLGQATLLDYFADTDQPTLQVAGGQTVTLYSTPILAPGAGMNLMMDLEIAAPAPSAGRVELSVLLLSDPLLPIPATIQQLPTLPPDGRHVRGTFMGAVRRLNVDLSGPLPAKVVLGDASDSPLQGMDALSRTPVVLRGNFGMLYELNLQNAGGVVGALAARGGLYKGAIAVTDPQLSRTDVLPLPLSGVIADSNAPVLFLRANGIPNSSSSAHHTPKSGLQKVLSTQNARGMNFQLQFVPASGSNLPVHLVFYRPANLPFAPAQPQPLPLPAAPPSNPPANPSNKPLEPNPPAKVPPIPAPPEEPPVTPPIGSSGQESPTRR
jgi:hypothetical protein